MQLSYRKFRIMLCYSMQESDENLWNNKREIVNIYIIGMERSTIETRNLWKRRLQEVLNESKREVPPRKKFKPKCNLPVLDNYEESPTESYWTEFPKNLEKPGKSLIDWEKLKELATFYKYPDKEGLEQVLDWLKNGAKLGCKGEFRRATKSTNARSALDDGEKVSDAIADWVEKKFCYGPVPLDEIDKDAKISGIMTRTKPSGAVRVILNLSSPENSSVNDGIDKNDFPTKMSSTKEWVQILNRLGRGARFTKNDMADAYKHIAVHPEDLNLQWFTWLNKGFQELALIFGCSSSAGIFDKVAKLVLFIVIKRAEFNPKNVIQHLDDVVAADTADSTKIEEFDKTFAEVAQELGIRLAPRDDKDKAFGPSTEGTVLGVQYDSKKWTWGLSEEKLNRICITIEELTCEKEVLQEQIRSIAGKIINIRDLVPGGKFHIDHIIRANNLYENGKEKIEMTEKLKKQLLFWRYILPVCSNKIKIPDLLDSMPPWTYEAYTDAAGGSAERFGKGVGVVTKDWWSYLCWSDNINNGIISQDGCKLNKSMAVLELIGPLLVICAGYKWCTNNCVRVWVDNQASVSTWAKGYSYSSQLATTLVKAIDTVAAGLNCRFDIVKITRCSNNFAIMADSLSKGDFRRFRDTEKLENLRLPSEMQPIPKTVLKWVARPQIDDMLGHRILLELATQTEVLSYNC